MTRTAFASLTLMGALLATTAMPMPAMAQDTVIRMWTFLNVGGTAPREVALAQIIENFEAENPDIRIEVETQAWDQMTPRFLAAHGAGSAPDVIWVITDFLGDAIASGSLADLNELFINEWSEEEVADRAGPYWDLTHVDGSQYTQFTSRNYISVVYRPDLMEEAGIDPADISTWDDFLEAAEALTVRDDAGNVTRYGFAQGFSEHQTDPNLMIPMLLDAGEPLFHEDGRANFTSEAAIEAMRFQTDLITEHGVSPEQSATWTVDDVYEQFLADRVAMILGASVRVSTLQASLDADKVGQMLWPSADGEGHSPAVMAGWAVGVWSGSPNLEAAGRFVDYMLGPESDAIWVTVGGQTPGLISTLDELSDFIDQPGNEYLRIAAEGSANYGWMTPIEFSVGGYRQALARAAQEIVINGVEVEAALAAAEDEFNRQHER